MQTSIIRQRVADFMKAFAPFDALSDQDLLELAGSGRVKFHEADEYVYRQGDRQGHLVWIIQQGRVELVEESAAGERLRDVLGEGDLLGLDGFLNKDARLYSARTASDVILYGVAAPLFDSLVSRNPALKRFLLAHFSTTGLRGPTRTSWLDAAPPPADFLRSRLVLLAQNASREEAAARLIRANNHAVAFVDEGGRPAAILTAMELCADGNGEARSAARPFRSTMNAALSTRSAVREMLRAGTEELAVTAGGTLDEPLESILTASELALFCGHNPARLVGAIRRASGVAEIVPLLGQAKRLVLDGLAQPLDADDCCSIGSHVVSALSECCIRLSRATVLAAGIQPSEMPSCWLMFGQSARGDLLHPVVPAIAVVYDDSVKPPGGEDGMYFAAIAGEAMAWFHACGLGGPGLAWPDGSQPCMPLSEWKRLYSETIRNPLGHELYARREFFDIAALSGDLSILEGVRDHIRFELRDCEVTIALLANDTLAHLPPLSFFRGMALALDGAQHDSIDLRRAAISPIADAARVLALAQRSLTPANTLTRLHMAARDFPEGAPVFRAAAEAFRIALYYEALAGNAPIAPCDLGKFDQRLLKNAFHSIHHLLEYSATLFIPSA